MERAECSCALGQLTNISVVIGFTAPNEIDA